MDLQSLYTQLFDPCTPLRLNRSTACASVSAGKVNGVDLPDVISTKSIAKAREFLGMLDPPVVLSEELTVKEAVLRMLTFQAMLLHFEK